MYLSRMSRRVNNIVAAFAVDLAESVATAVTRAAGQSGGLAAAVVYLSQEPGVGVERLRSVLGLSQPATVRLVNQLQADGLARRTRHGDDARRVELRLTPAGERRAAEIAAARLAAAGDFLAALDAADRQALVEVIGRIYARRAPAYPEAERICRLCDLEACPERSCPVTKAIAG
jgi:MarR family transcriptional regulator, negative regulator of the multidrug operon emrRAB